MARYKPEDENFGPPPRGRPALPVKFSAGILLAASAVALIVLWGAYAWFIQRIEVPAGSVLVLVSKTGENLPPEAAEQVVLYPALLEKLGEKAGSSRFKGIRYDVLPEGRYYFDPYYWERRIAPATIIGQNEVGIRIRLYGDPLPAGQTVAKRPNERGPLEEILPPGRHNLNPHAYSVVRVKPVVINEGCVGVQTLYSGETPKLTNRYVVERGERGVQPDVLPPGLYYNNPFVRRIDIVDVRSHTIDLRDAEAISFPSNDSFEILMEGTVEYAVRQDRAPYVMMSIGDEEDIEQKIILPFARSFSRIEGSKLDAREFISGEARTAFQQRVFEGLREQCYAQGIEIRAVLFRRIEPPAQIANPISDRQVAEQQVRQYENEIRLAESQAELVRQEEMQKQNQAIGAAQRDVVAHVVEAEQTRSVALLQANQRLEVARLALEAAKSQAAALVSRGEADAEMAMLGFEADARPLRDAVAAFGGGDAYAQYFFYQKLAPAFRSVLASTDGPFADLLRALAAPGAVPAGAAAQAPAADPVSVSKASDTPAAPNAEGVR